MVKPKDKVTGKDSLRVGFFLARRVVKRSNRYVTFLIITILALIFLNIVAVGGLLIGLIKSANVGYINLYSGAVRIRPPEEKEYVQLPDEIINFAKSLPGFVSLSPRLQSAAKLEVGYKERKAGSQVSNVSAPMVGMDPDLEGQTTTIKNYVVEGRFLTPDDRDKIVLGSVIAGRGETFAFGEALADIQIGSKVLATYGNGVSREYTVVGIVKTKVAVLNLEAFVTMKEMNDVLGFTSPHYSNIAIKIADPNSADRF